MSAPYGRTTRVLASNGIPLTDKDGMRGGDQRRASADSMFNHAGQINADSTKSLMEALGRVTATKSRVAFVDPAKKAEDTAYLKAAFTNPGSGELEKVGNAVSNAIMDTMRRHNFTRRTLVEDTPDGLIPIIRVSAMDVQAQVVVDTETVTSQDIRGRFFQPPEFEIATAIVLTNKEVAQIGPEFLDEKFNDGLVAIWTTEDRLTRQMFLNTQGIYNTPFGFSQFTPSVLAAMKTRLESWGLTATTLLISYDIWNDIIANSDWQDFYSPLEKHELAVEGRLGKLMGLDIITDGYIYDNLRVLQPGEVFVLGAPNQVGKVLQRRPLEAFATDHRVIHKSTRGWFLEQQQAQAVVGARACVYGSRL